LEDLRDWNDYVEAHKPMLQVQAEPQLRETFLSGLGRELTPALLMYTGGSRMKFRTDFYRMKLFCGGKEVEPIQPGKAATVLNAHNAFVNVTDATYVGTYFYPPDAISTSCGHVRLELYSERQPNTPQTRDLDEKTVLRISKDFEPYFASQKEAVAPQ
jgi:hypothetical protein